MMTKFNKLLTHPTDRPQVWIIGARDQVNHWINAFHVKRLMDYRAKFVPIVLRAGNI